MAKVKMDEYTIKWACDIEQLRFNEIFYYRNYQGSQIFKKCKAFFFLINKFVGHQNLRIQSQFHSQNI